MVDKFIHEKLRIQYLFSENIKSVFIQLLAFVSYY